MVCSDIPPQNYSCGMLLVMTLANSMEQYLLIVVNMDSSGEKMSCMSIYLLTEQSSGDARMDIIIVF
jgi:hypothetical protein